MKTKPARSMVLPRMVVTGHGVLEQIPAIIAELDIPERGLIVCDTNTLDIAGNKVIEYLEAGGHPMEKVEITGANIMELERVESYSNKIDFLVGLGGGRPIDIAKQAGFNNNIPFISIPTAASHDGFGSARASISRDGRKMSMQAIPPIAVVADTEIISKAHKYGAKVLIDGAQASAHFKIDLQNLKKLENWSNTRSVPSTSRRMLRH